jgi:DNA polymerase (family 10)
VDVLLRIAFAAEVLGDTAIDAAAFSTGAWNLRQLEGDMEALHAAKQLGKAGLRKAVVKVVGQVIAGEPVAELVELESRIPEGLFEIRQIKGLGPKKIRALWTERGITTLGELEYACRENRLVELKGFGAKTQQNVLAEIELVRSRAGQLRLDRALRLGERVREALGRRPEIAQAELAGEARRRKELIRAPLELIALVRPDADGARVLEEVLIELGADAERRIEGVPIEVRLVDRAERWGAALVEATGSAEWLAQLKERGQEPSAWPGESEENVFSQAGLPYIEPEQRETRVPLPALGRERPRLVRRADLAGALHNHTLASDGVNTATEMRAAAIARGLTYLGLTDHSRTASYARGLEAGRLLEQKAQLRTLNADPSAASCLILHGVESDILADGGLDYPPEVLAELDLVVASVHQRHGQKRPEMTARMNGAASNPWTTIVGHPTGRLLLGRAPTDFDLDAFLDACARSGCAVELNASPQRLDLAEEHLARAKERGIPISIGADAHSADELDFLEFGIAIARRAGLTPYDVLNCRPLDDLLRWLAARRASALTGAA